MANDDDVLINVRTVGADKAARDAKKVGDAWQDTAGRWRAANGRFLSMAEQAELGVRKIDNAQRRMSFSLSKMNSGLLSTNTAATATRRGAYLLGGTITATGGLAIKTGLEFDAFKESSGVAFEQLIGSAAGARQEFEWLQKTAASTPFELRNITGADQQLLAFNFSLRQTHGWLTTIGDAASVKGPEAIQRIVTAIGQIKSKGRLQGDELLQLQELGLIDSPRLAKDLGLTPKQLYSGNASIDSVKALRAIKKQIDDTFGGQAAKQAKTFNGQLSNLHDNITQNLGKASFPLFEKLRQDVFPALNDASGDIGKILDRNDLTGNQKLEMSGDVARQALRPFFLEARREFDSMHIGDRLERQFELAAPQVVNAAAGLAPKAASAFVHAWWDSGMWGKLFTLGLLSKKLGLFGTLGGMAKDRFDGGFNGRGGGKGGGKGGRSAPGFLKSPLLGPIAAGALAGEAFAHTSAFDAIQDSGPVRTIRGALGQHNDNHDPMTVGGHVFYDDGRAPTRARTKNASAASAPLTQVILNLDGKILAQVVARHAADAQARRGR